MMGKLLHFEFHKLLRAKSLYICLAVLVFLTLIPIGMLYLLTSPDLLGIVESEGVTISAADDVALTGSYFLLSALSTSGAVTVLAVFLGIFACGDFSDGTIKNVIARGYTRTQVYLAKLAACLTATLLLTLVCCLAGTVAASALWSFGDALTGLQLLSLLAQLLLMLGFAGLLFLLCMLTKKAGAAIAVGVLAPSLVSAILSLVDVWLGQNNVQLSDCWPPNLLTQLAGPALSQGLLLRALLCALGFALVSTALGLVRFRRSEF